MGLGNSKYADRHDAIWCLTLSGGTASPMPLLFALTALAEIVGCYLPWLVVKGAACGCWRLPLCRLVCLPDC